AEAHGHRAGPRLPLRIERAREHRHRHLPLPAVAVGDLPGAQPEAGIVAIRRARFFQAGQEVDPAGGRRAALPPRDDLERLPRAQRDGELAPAPREAEARGEREGERSEEERAGEGVDAAPHQRPTMEKSTITLASSIATTKSVTRTTAEVIAP